MNRLAILRTCNFAAAISSLRPPPPNTLPLFSPFPSPSLYPLSLFLAQQRYSPPTTKPPLCPLPCPTVNPGKKKKKVKKETEGEEPSPTVLQPQYLKAPPPHNNPADCYNFAYANVSLSVGACLGSLAVSNHFLLSVLDLVVFLPLFYFGLWRCLVLPLLLLP